MDLMAKGIIVPTAGEKLPPQRTPHTMLALIMLCVSPESSSTRAGSRHRGQDTLMHICMCMLVG